VLWAWQPWFPSSIPAQASETLFRGMLNKDQIEDLTIIKDKTVITSCIKEEKQMNIDHIHYNSEKLKIITHISTDISPRNY
jgi:hypothetical protein